MPPSTPSACAETPTQASPSSMSSGLRYIQSGADSPSDSFIHSTTTVPLKRAGLAGRRTMIRVLYAADVVGAMRPVPARRCRGGCEGMGGPRSEVLLFHVVVRGQAGRQRSLGLNDVPDRHRSLEGGGRVVEG